MAETVHLQFGDLANLSCVHFWNSQTTQKSLAQTYSDSGFDYRAIFREAASGESKPRAVVFEPALGRDGPQDCTELDLQDCAHDTQTQRADKRTINAEDPQSWRDLSFFRFHPRTLVSHAGPTAGFLAGVEQTEADRVVQDEAAESIRFMAEECDSLRSFNVVVDGAGWRGGQCLSILSQVGDEYQKKPIHTCSLYPAYQNIGLPLEDPVSAELVVSFVRLSQVSALFVPLYLPPHPTSIAMFGRTFTSRPLDLSIIGAAFLDTLASGVLSGSDLPSGVVEASMASSHKDRFSLTLGHRVQGPVSNVISRGFSSLGQDSSGFSSLGQAFDEPIYVADLSEGEYKLASSPSQIALSTRSELLARHLNLHLAEASAKKGKSSIPWDERLTESETMHEIISNLE